MEKPPIVFEAVGHARDAEEVRAILADRLEMLLQTRKLAEILQVEVHILEWVLGAGVVPSSCRPGGLG